MTNVLVKIVAATAVVVTNWTSVGTFNERQSGLSYDVLQGQMATNYVGKMEAEGQTAEFIFKSIQGPKLDYFRLVPIATQGINANVMPPIPIPFQPKFIPIWETNKWLSKEWLSNHPNLWTTNK